MDEVPEGCDWAITKETCEGGRIVYSAVVSKDGYIADHLQDGNSSQGTTVAEAPRRHSAGKGVTEMTKPTIEEMVEWMDADIAGFNRIPTPYILPDYVKMLTAIRDHLLAQQANTLPLDSVINSGEALLEIIDQVNWRDSTGLRLSNVVPHVEKFRAAIARAKEGKS